MPSTAHVLQCLVERVSNIHRVEMLDWVCTVPVPHTVHFLNTETWYIVFYCMLCIPFNVTKWTHYRHEMLQYILYTKLKHLHQTKVWHVKEPLLDVQHVKHDLAALLLLFCVYWASAGSTALKVKAEVWKGAVTFPALWRIATGSHKQFTNSINNRHLTWRASQTHLSLWREWSVKGYYWAS